MRRFSPVYTWLVLIGGASCVTGCRGPRTDGDVSDSTFVGALVDLRRVSTDVALDSAGRSTARAEVLQRRGLTAAGLEDDARVVARDVERARRVWAEIDRRASASTTPSPTPGVHRDSVRASAATPAPALPSP